jgi:hypothetical protein
MLEAPTVVGVDAVVQTGEIGSPCLKRLLGSEGVGAIVGMTGAESVGRLDSALRLLPPSCPDSWYGLVSTRAREDLERLRAVASLGPDSVWRLG